MLKTYGKTDSVSEHFRASEFSCPCCGKTVIDTELADILERLRAALKCSKIVLSSGYRCYTHDKQVGGSGYGYHTKGCAADICCYDAGGKRIPSAQVVLALEDMGDVYGIGLNCGGNKYYTHVDSRPQCMMWWGDESIKGFPGIGKVKRGCTSYYIYLGVECNAVCPYPVPAGTVKIGDKGDAVRWVQWHLVKRCGACIKIDGVFGVKTREDVMHYQRTHGLAADGVVGRLTRAAMEKA